jgi:hypothetical protein
MARNFIWRDLWKLPRFYKKQLFLDTSLSLTYAPGMISSVIFSLLVPHGSARTSIHVCRNEDHPAFIGLVNHSPHKPSARVAFIAPEEAAAHPEMSQLLSYLSQQAGEMGAFQVLVEVEEENGILNSLRKVGFQAYAKQRLWKFSSPTSNLHSPFDWIPVQASCVGDIYSLYQQLAPPEVKRIEPPPTVADLQGLMCWAEDGLVGYSAAQFGPQGVLLDVWLDPAQNHVPEHLRAIRKAIPNHLTKPVYVRVRTYQASLETALAEMNALPGPEQIVMVKRLAAHYKAKQAFNLNALEQRPDVSTPLINTERKS